MSKPTRVVTTDIQPPPASTSTSAPASASPSAPAPALVPAPISPPKFQRFRHPMNKSEPTTEHEHEHEHDHPQPDHENALTVEPVSADLVVSDAAVLPLPDHTSSKPEECATEPIQPVPPITAHSAPHDSIPQLVDPTPSAVPVLVDKPLPDVSLSAKPQENPHHPDKNVLDNLLPRDDTFLDTALLKLAGQNKNKNRSKRSPEWLFFADAGMWQTMNGEESKFRIANCRYCLKCDIETKIRGKIETMKNHILECERIPQTQKAVYERHPSRHRKRNASGNADGGKKQKIEGLLKVNTMPNLDGVENRAVVLHGARDMRVERIPIPAIPPGHVLISMRSVGICGSDVHYWTDGRIGDFIVEKPMILGHEGSGVVRVVGEDVRGLEEGDRVALEPGVPCSNCITCKEGRYNLCPHVKFAATPPVDGSLAHFIVHPASYCYKLPPMISFDEAALFEPLSVGIHACRRGKVSLGDSVLITGAGPIGLVTLLVAKASGASQVTILDIDADRLQVAKELGADKVMLTHTESDPKVAVEGIEADVCIDATGVASAVNSCIYGARRGGVVVLIGMGKSHIPIPSLEVAIRELDIRGVFRYCNTYPSALELVASGKVQMKRLVTHRFKMVNAKEAFEVAHDRSSKAIKVVIDCGPAQNPIQAK